MRTRKQDRTPWETGDMRADAQIKAALAAVSVAMPFLDPQDILFPQQGTNGGASLGRQVMMYVLAESFGWSKNAITAVGTADRKTTLKTFRLMWDAMERRRFARWVGRVQRAAERRFERLDPYR